MELLSFWLGESKQRDRHEPPWGILLREHPFSSGMYTVCECECI